MRTLRANFILTLVAASVSACTGGPSTGDASDVTRDAVTDTIEAGAHCVSDNDCSDHVFCNGAERCMPGASSADARGCTAPPAPACAAPMVCDESMSRCTSECPDNDGDGHHGASCGGDDCDDADMRRFPGNAEVCDGTGHDEDCDPCTVASASDGDSDHDGFISNSCFDSYAGPTPTCDPLRTRIDGAAHHVTGADCNDANTSVHPTASEVCNGMDDNCDGNVDEGVSMQTCYADADGDSYAPAGATMRTACSCMAGLETTRAPATGSVDCNDANAGIHPTATDICDMRDNDCDGSVDNGAGAAYYADCDGDGQGDAANSRTGCMVPTTPPTCSGGRSGTWTEQPFDCDDTRNTVYRGAAEVCDGRDNDCNGTSDDATSSTVASDIANCGACGHACAHPGAGCSAGVCVGDYVEAAIAIQRTCARRGSGQVECWGTNDMGLLGVGATPRIVMMPMPVPGLTDARALGGDSSVMCAIRASGSVVCWGGIPGRPQTTPTEIVSLADARIVAPRMDTSASDVLVVHGDLVESYGRSVGDTWVPGVAFTGMSDVIEVAVSAGGSPQDFCVVHATGLVECVRNEASTGRPLMTPASNLTDALSIAMPEVSATAIAARRTGEVASWNLPIAGTATSFMASRFGSDADAVEVGGVGGSTSFALVRNTMGEVFAETSPTSSRTTTGVTNAVRLYGDTWNHACMLRRTGRLACVGDNGSGELGNGSTGGVTMTAVDVIDP